MNNPAIDGSGVVRVWRAAVSESRIISAGRALASMLGRGRRVLTASAAPRHGLGERRDQALIHLLESSVVVRLVSLSGAQVLRAWRGSSSATALDRWTGVPLEQRVRLSAIALGAAVLVHLTLTGFSAPEPTATARAVWIGVLLVVVLTGVAARGVAAAWNGWTIRRGAQSGEPR